MNAPTESTNQSTGPQIVIDRSFDGTLGEAVHIAEILTQCGFEVGFEGDNIINPDFLYY